MREILFRGKNYDGEWIEGFFVHQGRCYEIYHKDYEEFPSRFIEPKTVGQYTGLTDKNGTKVFEGDIVAIPPNMSRKRTLGVVKFGDYKTPPYGVDKTNRGFYIRWYYENEAIEEMLRRDIVFWFNYSHVDISIIGNIYDNPELLEVEK